MAAKPTTVAMCVAVLSAAGTATPASASTPLLATTFPGRVLAAHNVERTQVGARALEWDPILANGAAAHARYMASTGNFAHSNRRLRRGVGENLWMGSRGAFSIEAMVGSWAYEKRRFVRGIFPAVSRTGRWFDVAHYSQIVWPTTTRLGCAMASSRRADYLVCRYSPAGNIDGRPVP